MLFYTPPPAAVYTPPPVQYTPPPVQHAPPPVQAPPPPVMQRSEPIQQPAVVLPLSRNAARSDAPPVLTGSFSGTGLDRLLRIAAARGASTLYLASLARPSIRVDGEIQMLDESSLTPSDVEALLIDLMPERNREALRSGVGTEWICDVPDVGRVRCMTFRDHRGAGGIFRMMPVRAISADQLGLSREIQALGAEAEGLVLVAGPRSSGKSTLLSAFVDLINRTRRDHVITIESEIKVVHENRHSLVSQREVRGDADEMLAVVRGAIRENPDVIVVEELRTADMVTVALDAANSGHLVIGALPAHNASGAIDRIIDLYPPELRRHVQLALAENLRRHRRAGAGPQPAGGRVAAREILLNTSAVASVIAEGKTSQLPMAIEGGRKTGCCRSTIRSCAFVQNGTVDARYRRAADRTGFLRSQAPGVTSRAPRLERAGRARLRGTARPLRTAAPVLHHEPQHIVFGEIADRPAVGDRPFRFAHAAALGSASRGRAPPDRRPPCRHAARCSPLPIGPPSPGRSRRA